MNALARLARATVPRSLTALSRTVVPCRSMVLDAHSAPQLQGATYNPEWTPDGNEGGVDTNKLPWVPVDAMPGCSIKPVRVSPETGAYTALVKVPKGVTIPKHVNLGATDTFILSGKLTYGSGPMKGSIGPGVWGYAPAGALMEGNTAEEDTEYLATFYGPVAFLDSSNKVQSLLTGQDVRAMADSAGIKLLPTTLAEAMETTFSSYSGPSEPLAISDVEMGALCSHGADVAQTAELANPHYVDTNAIPWIINPEAPDIALKIMRVSAETGSVSLIVRQNGQAPPHYHLGPADFFILAGRIGYRAGPAEGYGPGTYMYEPAGARHEATQPVETDLIYTSNVWGPIQFDSGVGTPPVAVFSWMSYLEAANAFQTPLIASTFPGDQGTMLAQN